MIPLAFPDDVEVSEETEPVVLATVNMRMFYRDDYIDRSGSGIEEIRSYVVSTDQDDVIKLMGGSTGASFNVIFYWVKVGSKLGSTVDDAPYISKKLIRAYCYMDTTVLGWTTTRQEDVDGRYKAFEDAKKEASDLGCFVVYESDVISLLPGETFTIVNQENYYAKEYFTERQGFIQWGLAAEVKERQFNEAHYGNDNFGSEVERATKVKNLATKLYRFLKPGTPPPEDFTIQSEEEGGTLQEILGDSLFDVFRGLGAQVLPWVQGALLIAAAVVAVILLIAFRAPLGALAEVSTDLLKGAMARE